MGDPKVVFVATGADEWLAVTFRFVVPRPGAGRIDVAAVVFRLGVHFGVPEHPDRQAKEIPGVRFFGDAEGLVRAQRADREWLDRLVSREDRRGETLSIARVADGRAGTSDRRALRELDSGWNGPRTDSANTRSTRCYFRDR